MEWPKANIKKKEEEITTKWIGRVKTQCRQDSGIVM